MDGRFTHGGEYVILTPVFKSGGHQRVPATTHLFDHVGEFWWGRTDTEILRLTQTV